MDDGRWTAVILHRNNEAIGIAISPPGMESDWEISQSLTGDDHGVRCACILSQTGEILDNYRVLIGTQAGSMFVFDIPAGTVEPVPYQHNHAVTSVLSGGRDNVFVTACKDAGVRIFDGTTFALLRECMGHDKPVTSLAWIVPDEYLISGSWDGTAKIWNVANGALVATLDGHENSVCVTGLPSTDGMLRVATGSAGIAENNRISGHTVRLWAVDPKTGESKLETSVANDHEGPIRDIALVDDDGTLMIATCSNDGTVRLRELQTAKSLSTLAFAQAQHPPMLLSVTSNATTLVSGAEDGQVVFWEHGSSPQIVPHPASVWKVLSCPNGDIATCSDDGKLRIFTRSSDRMAPTSERQAFADVVQRAQEKQSSGPTPEEVAKLPHWNDRLQHRGKSEGFVQVFQRDGVAIAAQWSMDSQTWLEVGQVTGSRDSGSIGGVTYDHVLPVEIDRTEGGVATLQLGYNTGENPFVAAQRFIDDNMLPQYHLNQIADYVQQRVGQSAPTLGAAAPVATAGVPVVSYKYIPAKGYKAMGLPEKSASTTLQKMQEKIIGFGRVSEAEQALLTTLSKTLCDSSRYHASTVSDAELVMVDRFLNSWPVEEVFAAIDLARLVALHPDAAGRQSVWGSIVARVLALCSEIPPDGPAATAIPMLALRLFSNCIKGGSGSRDAVCSRLGDILTCSRSFVGSTNKNVRLSLATLLYNVASYGSSNGTTDSFAAEIVPLLDGILSSKAYEAEATFRTLVTLGTVANSGAIGKAAAKALFLASKVEPAASPHGPDAKAAAKEVYAVLS